MSVSIELPWPDRILSPNARPHHMAKHRATKKARARAHQECLAAGLHLLDASAARITTTFFPPTRAHHDDDNLQARCKAYFDGISDALGLDDRHFRHAPVKRGEVRKLGAVLVEVEVDHG